MVLRNLEQMIICQNPFDFDELAARVKVMVRIKQAEDESRRLNKDLELSLIQQQKAFEELKTTKMRLAETEAAAKLTAVFEKFVPKEFIKRIAPDGLEFLKFGKADTDFISILFVISDHLPVFLKR